MVGAGGAGVGAGADAHDHHRVVDYVVDLAGVSESEEMDRQK